jgi:hypothetical protein
VIRDASQSALKLGVVAWVHDPRVAQLARQRGFVVPAPTKVAGGATAARAFVNHGRWIAWCPDCLHQAEAVWRGTPLFWCMACGNASINGLWRPLTWPEDVDAIEARLDRLPTQRQNWEPWAPTPSEEEEAEWAARVAEVRNPDAGLVVTDG